jgi:hypothetical protein
MHNAWHTHTQLQHQCIELRNSMPIHPSYMNRSSHTTIPHTLNFLTKALDILSFSFRFQLQVSVHCRFQFSEVYNQLVVIYLALPIQRLLGLPYTANNMSSVT